MLPPPPSPVAVHERSLTALRCGDAASLCSLSASHYSTGTEATLAASQDLTSHHRPTHYPPPQLTTRRGADAPPPAGGRFLSSQCTLPRGCHRRRR
uniref:Uncharacterized protein n=1 Tax=Mycena chlorophos TaxID=658473 RepID=A0ABQ0LEU3_MYCCL|nr:predicted protein [Mycena chlorophos]